MSELNITENDSVITKSKRGRKPKNPKQELKIEVPVEEKVPKKRGRKPKPKTEADLLPKVHKKRGRKPKQKTEEELNKVPKKRGRKPKDKYVSSDKAITTNVVNEETVILHLPINSALLNSKYENNNNLFKYNPEISDPLPYEPDNTLANNCSTIDTIINKNPLKLVIKDDKKQEESNEESNEETNEESNEEYPDKTNIEVIDENESDKDIKEDIKDITNKYNSILSDYTEKRVTDISNSNKIGTSKISHILYDYQESNKNKLWPACSSIACMWDFASFTGKPYGLPMRKVNNTVYMFGNFCSPQCAAAYNFNMNDDSDEKWHRYELLNWMYCDEIENNNTIKLAPNRLTLKKIGGKLSIEEFRNISKDNKKDYKIIHPPIISLIPIIEEINIDVNRRKDTSSSYKEHMKKVDDEFKLKRNKPLPDYKNTLESCMSLKYV
jgi:hypothetical protein